ncbi:hypothetical protein [Piscinibacter sp.]|uniref:hypothetical protein n=1 Tax=Piscinibacter sp. TaxID=1903157 RepID=UPI0035596545
MIQPASARRWAHDLRVGPFFIGEYKIPYLYQGVERPVYVKFAGGYSGSMLIELVQPDDGPSVFRDHLNERGESLHHMQTRPADFDTELALFKEAGYASLATGQIPGGVAEYFDTYADYGCGLKVHYFPERSIGLLSRMEDAHRTWDGTRPIRSWEELDA